MLLHRNALITAGNPIWLEESKYGNKPRLEQVVEGLKHLVDNVYAVCPQSHLKTYSFERLYKVGLNFIILKEDTTSQVETIRMAVKDNKQLQCNELIVRDVHASFKIPDVPTEADYACYITPITKDFSKKAVVSVLPDYVSGYYKIQSVRERPESIDSNEIYFCAGAYYFYRGNEFLSKVKGEAFHYMSDLTQSYLTDMAEAFEVNGIVVEDYKEIL